MRCKFTKCLNCYHKLSWKLGASNVQMIKCVELIPKLTVNNSQQSATFLQSDADKISILEQLLIQINKKSWVSKCLHVLHNGLEVCRERQKKDLIRNFHFEEAQKLASKLLTRQFLHQVPAIQLFKAKCAEYQKCVKNANFAQDWEKVSGTRSSKWNSKRREKMNETFSWHEASSYQEI